MVPSTTKVRGRAYRYYRCSSSEKRGASSCPTRSIPADSVEQFVADQVRRIGADPQLQEETFRQAVAQVKAQRRGLKAEKKRAERDLATVRADVQRLVDTVSRVKGPAADAIAVELGKAQERLATLENRQQEIGSELTNLDAQAIDREHLAGALEEFDPIWEVLLTPERERVLKLLIERIDISGESQELAISWRLAGFGQLSQEMSS
jgi:site-specific DNA recombinase